MQIEKEWRVLRTIDPQTGTEVTPVVPSVPIGQLLPSAPCPNKSAFAVGGQSPAVWDVVTMRPVLNFRLSEQAPDSWKSVWFTQDGRGVISFDGHAVRLWDAGTGNLNSTICDHTGAERCHVSVSEGLVVTFGRTVGAKVWTIGGEELLTYKPEFGPLYGVDLRGRVLRFVAGGVDRYLRVSTTEVGGEARHTSSTRRVPWRVCGSHRTVCGR
jgi:hypothetical protein